MQVTLVACAAAGAFLQTPAALANGRFPNANQLIVDPSDPQRIVLRATFGAVQSTDGGASWRWICERAIGYSGFFDPAIAVTGNGTVLAGLPVSTSRSTDRGCTWPVATASSVSAYWIIDLAVDRASPSRAIALIAPTSSARGFQATLAESRDHGQTWGAASRLTEDFSPTTVEIAPSKPTRIYAVGKGPQVRFGEVARSDDGGATWATIATFDLGEGTLGEPALMPFLSTIDPLNPDGIYVRVSDPKGDRLEYSADGGGSWVTLFTGTGELLGFALSADGKKIAVGGPKDGIHIATNGATSSFAKVSTAGARCLTYAGDVLWVCGNEAVDGYTVGSSTDDGTTINGVFHLADLQPLACPSGTVTGMVCPGEWPALATAIGAEVGVATDGGVSDAIAAATAPDAAANVPPSATAPASAGRGGCGCTVSSRAGAATAIFTALMFVSLGVRRIGRAR